MEEREFVRLQALRENSDLRGTEVRLEAKQRQVESHQSVKRRGDKMEREDSLRVERFLGGQTQEKRDRGRIYRSLSAHTTCVVLLQWLETPGMFVGGVGSGNIRATPPAPTPPKKETKNKTDECLCYFSLSYMYVKPCVTF